MSTPHTLAPTPELIAEFEAADRPAELRINSIAWAARKRQHDIREPVDGAHMFRAEYRRIWDAA